MNEQQKLLLELVKIAKAVNEESEELSEEQSASIVRFLDVISEVAKMTGNVSELRQEQRIMLTPFNEGIGPDVEKFWKRVEEQGLEVERRDRVKEILARGRVPDIEDYRLLVKHWEYLQECGKVSREEAQRLVDIMVAFSKAPQNRRFFGGGPDANPVLDEPKEFDVPVGQLVQVKKYEYRYDYWGMEKYDLLAEQGYQGGGYTWEGIIQGLLEMHAPDVLAAIRFDPEGDCVCVWSDDLDALQTVAGLVARALDSDELLLEAAAKGATE